jgi:iron complex outermembrane receptor protein
VIVTATKRETNLQKTPISISVMGEETLKARHVQSLYDLADGGVPSLRVATFEARQSALTIGIRGIVPLDANQPAREQGVGIYIDGVYLGRQHGLNASLFDTERVEVLKGPQGTLFGRNTEGGALSIITKAPTGEFGGRVSGGFGNYGSYNAGVHIDLPAIGTVSTKVEAVYQKQDATTTNPLPGQTGWNYFDRRGARVAFRWKPSENVTNDLAVDYGHDENSPFYSQLLNYNPNGCVAGAQSAASACYLPGTAYTNLTGTVKPVSPLVVVNGRTRMTSADIGVPQQPSVDITKGIANTFKWQAIPEMELRSITALRTVEVEQWDNSGGAHRVPVVTAGCTGNACNFSRYSLATLDQRQFSQELQAVGTVSKFDYVAGLFYFREKVSDDAATPNSAAFNSTLTAVTILDPCTGSAGFGSLPGCRSIDRASEVDSKSYAAYGQVTWNFADEWNLTVGARQTRDKKRGDLLFSRNINYTTNPTVAARNGYAPLDKTWNNFSPMATLAYNPSETLHFYGKVATGYRSGGASSRTSNYQAFDPEKVRSYELGMKTDFWDRRARLNMAAYTMDRRNSQVDISSIQSTATGNFNNLVTINAPGITKIRGLEADLIVRPIDRLTLTASYAYTYTKIPPVLITATAGTAQTSVLQNFYVVFTPRNAASAAVDYDMPFANGTNLRFHLDGNYSQATQTFDQFATKNDAATLFNARVSVADIPTGSPAKLVIGLWARNLLDEQYVYRRDPSNSLPGAPTTSVANGSINNVLGDYGNFNAPRTYGIDVTMQF